MLILKIFGRPVWRLLTILLAVVSAAAMPLKAGASGLISTPVAALLDTLDRELSLKQRYDQEKQQSISRVKGQLARARDLEQRYWLERDLFDEYSVCNSDSALHYAQSCLDLAQSLGRRDWMEEMKINISYIYGATGFLEKARSILESVDRKELSVGNLIKYYEKLLFLYTHEDQYVGKNSLETPSSEEANALLDSVSKTLPASEPKYCWFLGWRSLSNPDKGRKAIAELEKIMGNASFTTQQDAMNAWMMSRLYDRVGDGGNSLRYLVLSAIADVRAANKEIASLEELANAMLSRGDLKRANDYITFCIQCANEYKSRVRVSRLSELQYEITRAYNDKTERQATTIRLSLWVVIAISVALLISLAFLLVQMRRLRASKQDLDQTNNKLNSKVEELQHTREELKAANALLDSQYQSVRKDATELSLANQDKEKYIADIFALCSSYINKMDSFRRNILRLIMEGKLDKVKEIAKSPELSHAELKELYNSFDRIFLKVYPDFVEQVNSLLRPEERLTPRKEGSLNTDLRIYALVRLGVNDSTQISQFLHCSVQSVYNSRLRTRNKSLGKRELFDTEVRQLCSPAF